MKGQQYVCGFAFDQDLSSVLLIRKNRGPNNLAGTLNGIGGKIEHAEGFRAAMAREFLEETGIETAALEWFGFHTLRYRNGAQCRFFTTRLDNDRFRQYQTLTDEHVSPVWTGWVIDKAMMCMDPLAFGPRDRMPYPNLAYLVPMALHLHLLPVEDRNLE